MTFRRADWDNNGASEVPYSTMDEVATGKLWTDGRMIYRKGYTGTCSNSNPEVSLDLTSLGISETVSYWGRIFRTVISTEDQYVNIPGTTHPSVIGEQILVEFTSTAFTCNAGSADGQFDGSDYIIFIFYTKS